MSKMCSTNRLYLKKIKTNEYGECNVHELDSFSKENNVGLVSIMYVNNETGSENDVAYIGDVCKKNGWIFHTDCVQAAGSHKINVNDIGCNMLSISSHKIHGPKGIGALYVDPKLVKKMLPIICGGSHQEFGLRGGTENVAGIVGFGKACEIAEKEFREDMVRMSILKQIFYVTLMRELAENDLQGVVHINGEKIIRPGKILNLRFDGIDSETLVLLLDSNGVAVSSGSACRSHDLSPSHVLKAMGLSNEEAGNSIRVSFSKTNTDEEVVDAARIVATCVKELLR